MSGAPRYAVATNSADIGGCWDSLSEAIDYFEYSKTHPEIASIELLDYRYEPPTLIKSWPQGFMGDGT